VRVGPTPMTEPQPKLIPRSPYVEEETDEEFATDNEADKVDDNLDDRICRICFSGQDEVKTLGKLISPCKCRQDSLSLSSITDTKRHNEMDPR
jgi:RING-variant domain